MPTSSPQMTRILGLPPDGGVPVDVAAFVSSAAARVLKVVDSASSDAPLARRFLRSSAHWEGSGSEVFFEQVPITDYPSHYAWSPQFPPTSNCSCAEAVRSCSINAPSII